MIPFPNPQPEKVVAIARDVLAQLAANKLTLTLGAYLGSRMPEGKTAPTDGDLRDHIDEVPCHVCALGAVLLSKARLYDEVPTRSLWSESFERWELYKEATTDLLKDIFSPQQQDLIEAAYMESKHHAISIDRLDNNQYVLLTQAAKWFLTLSMYTERAALLQWIMENIIANGGHFDPTQPCVPEPEKVPAAVS